MKTKKLIFLTIGILISLTLIVIPTNVKAFSFLEPWTGDIKIKYSDWESYVSERDDELYGIAKVASIQGIGATNPLLWYDGYGGEELTAQFGGFIVRRIDETDDGVTIRFRHGWLDVYLDSTPDFDATFPGTGVTDGILFLSALATPGIIPGTQVTLYSEISSLTSPFTGSGEGYFEITGGAYEGIFARDVFGPGLDLFLRSDVEARPGGYYGWPVTSEDPIIGSIPEPGTIMLLGAGLIGIGFFGRKKMMK